MDTLDQVQNQTKWTIDPAHSELTFKVRHLMISNVKGEFTDFNVEMITNGDVLSTADIQVSINAASISTNNEDRDNHLKAPDFFDVANHPQLTFKSEAVSKKDDENYQLTGILTIKGVSREVVLDVEFGGFVKDPYGNEKAGFSLSGKINRKDFGLNWNAALETGGVMVGEEVKLGAEIQLVRQP